MQYEVEIRTGPVRRRRYTVEAGDWTTQWPAQITANTTT